jgi:hypothetical protein
MYHAASQHETGTGEDILDELNDDRTFVPFHYDEAGAGTLLLNKRYIVRVHVPDLTVADLRPGEAEELPITETCTLWLVDGSHLTGRPVVETPASASRVLDKLNHAPTFMTFVTDDGVDFVHGAQIVRVIRDG